MNTNIYFPTSIPPSTHLGDETWRTSELFPGYAASNFGRVIAIEKKGWHTRGYEETRKERLLVCSRAHKDGYLHHSIKGYIKGKQSYLAHRIVAIIWIPNPENKRFINHINGIKSDNRVENLEWVTRSENGIHAVKTGLHTALRGSVNGNSKLNENQVLQIRALQGKKRDKVVAKEYGIGRTTVSYIWKRKLWAHL